ncbi:hypothetical protein OS493_003941 [Desmophyllum pertusum]|uniref:Uncharacterized protein n=1 Tax=Desmophyllum pertusum TaxID=174260 RepID=A0A9W9ZVX7_9CNID|nr:hypothetical protein OS493_003941 [Desmophyllum pertusum]
MDSGLGELEDDDNIVTERSNLDKQKIVLLEDRPPTPELSIEGTQVPRRKSLKEKRVSFSEKQEEVRNRINALSPTGGVSKDHRVEVVWYLTLCCIQKLAM